MRKALVSLGLASLAALGSASPAGAWGRCGHRIIAELAAARLTPAARQKALELLERGQTLTSVASWADEVRRQPAWAFTDHWHYVSLEDPEAYFGGPARDDDVIVGILSTLAQLRDARAPRDKRASALKLFIHFLADVHQPLHVGRLGDRGGNDTRVGWFDGRNVPLHLIWDEGLIEREIARQSGLRGAEKCPAAEFGALLARRIPPPPPSDEGAVLAWAEESRAARAWVYDFPADRPLSDDYVARVAPLLHWRLAMAGYRLAAALERAFGGAPAPVVGQDPDELALRSALGAPGGPDPGLPGRAALGSAGAAGLSLQSEARGWARLACWLGSPAAAPLFGPGERARIAERLRSAAGGYQARAGRPFDPALCAR